MLKSRLLTAIILIPLVLGAVIGLSSRNFAWASAIFFSLAAWEWTRLSQLRVIQTRLCFMLVWALVLGGLSLLFGHWPWILGLGSLIWLLPCYWVLIFNQETPRFLTSSLLKGAMGIIVLSIAWYALNILHQLHWQWIILLFILVWAADTCAYFTGRAWGKTPLAPAVSPKKTWEGVAGGMAGVLFVAGCSFIASPLLRSHSLGLWLLVVLLTTFLAIEGDLFESLLKRIAGVKDSGKLLPGHGGILDRIDSLLSSLPFYALSIHWLIKEGG